MDCPEFEISINVPSQLREYEVSLFLEQAIRQTTSSNNIFSYFLSWMWGGVKLNETKLMRIRITADVFIKGKNLAAARVFLAGLA